MKPITTLNSLVSELTERGSNINGGYIEEFPFVSDDFLIGAISVDNEWYAMVGQDDYSIGDRHIFFFDGGFSSPEEAMRELFHFLADDSETMALILEHMQYSND